MGDEIASEVGTVLAGGKTAAQATEEIIERQSANVGKIITGFLSMAIRQVMR